ncbi:MAG: fused MFS/spermidine synthase [Nitrospirae bacterium]|nr:fused MFS/spermidine synthase [Magnetococcales bacterium]
MDNFLLSNAPSDDDNGPGYPLPANVILRRFWRGQTIEVIEEEMGTRALYFRSRLIQSRMDPTDPIRLVLPYSRHMMASLMFLPDTEGQKILMIGLGGGSLAKFILHHWPISQLDVVEIDGGMENLARTFFDLPEDPRLHIHVADGAAFLQTANDTRYDMILVDAFDHQGMAETVYARHFFVSARKLLTPTGLIVINATKTDIAAYSTITKILKSLFTDGLLRLPVRLSRNEILLCFPQPISQTQWIWAGRQAKVLEEKLSLEFAQFLRDLRRFSSPFWSRVI